VLAASAPPCAALFRIGASDDKEKPEAVRTGRERRQERCPIPIAIDQAPMVYRGQIDQVPARENAGADGPASVFADHDRVVMGARFVLEAIRRDS